MTLGKIWFFARGVCACNILTEKIRELKMGPHAGALYFVLVVRQSELCAPGSPLPRYSTPLWACIHTNIHLLLLSATRLLLSVCVRVCGSMCFCVWWLLERSCSGLVTLIAISTVTPGWWTAEQWACCISECVWGGVCILSHQKSCFYEPQTSDALCSGILGMCVSVVWPAV